MYNTLQLCRVWFTNAIHFYEWIFSSSFFLLQCRENNASWSQTRCHLTEPYLIDHFSILCFFLHTSYFEDMVFSLSFTYSLVFHSKNFWVWVASYSLSKIVQSENNVCWIQCFNWSFLEYQHKTHTQKVLGL